jgi:hypothetical protein
MAIKNILLVLFVIVAFTFCDSSTNSVVGLKEDREIKNVSFSVDTTYIQNSQLHAKGTVTNLGNIEIESPWYIEAQFYTDSTYQIKIGGNNTQISVPLEPYQSTFWALALSATTVDLNDYPYFRLSDFRAIYKN